MNTFIYLLKVLPLVFFFGMIAFVCAATVLIKTYLAYPLKDTQEYLELMRDLTSFFAIMTGLGVMMPFIIGYEVVDMKNSLTRTSRSKCNDPASSIFCSNDSMEKTEPAQAHTGYRAMMNEGEELRHPLFQHC